MSLFPVLISDSLEATLLSAWERDSRRHRAMSCALALQVSHHTGIEGFAWRCWITEAVSGLHTTSDPIFSPYCGSVALHDPKAFAVVNLSIDVLYISQTAQQWDSQINLS